MADKAKALAILRPGDILLYKATSGIGTAIEWGEWDAGKGDYQYTHAGLVLDPSTDQGFEQNPPSTHYTQLSQEAWDHIHVWRVTPGVLLSWDELKAWCASDLGVKYPYGKYFRFLGASILARIGLTSWAQSLDAGGKHSDKSWAVCSATVALALDNAKIGAPQSLWPKLAEDMRPCDIPLGQVYMVLGD